MDRIDIVDDTVWGLLVKAWATGKSKLANGYMPPHYPRTLAELDEQCGNATRPAEEIENGLPKPGLPRAPNIIITIPKSFKGLAVLQYSPEVVTIKLPPRDMVIAAEDEMEAGGKYIIPKFYEKFFKKPFVLEDSQKLEFHACRIGDYSVRNCG